MSLAVLYEIPNDMGQLAEWTFNNAASHADIIRVIFQTTGVQLSSFVLDPLDPRASDEWAYQHFVMHQQMDAILGIQGYDLTDVDFTRPNLMAPWITAHAFEHLQANRILNLG